MTPAGTLALTTADRQALIPMAAGYLILMSALGFGLYRLYRPRGAPSGAGRARSRPRRPARDRPRRPPGPAPGRAALLRQIAGTVVGGYLLLMAVIVAYYFGAARSAPVSWRARSPARRSCSGSRPRYSPPCPG